MQITQTSTPNLSPFTPTSSFNHGPNFKGVTLVQIPRQAFKNPGNFNECSKLFGKVLDKALGDKLKGKLGSVIGVFMPKLSKTFNIAESPSYTYAREAMKKAGNDYSIPWLRQNTGLPVKDVIDKDCYSFYVLTKEHRTSSIDILKQGLKNMVTFVNEGILKYPNNKEMSALYAQTKMGIEADKVFDKLIEGTPVKTFRLQNLDEIKNIVKDLDV